MEGYEQQPNVTEDSRRETEALLKVFGYHVSEPEFNRVEQLEQVQSGQPAWLSRPYDPEHPYLRMADFYVRREPVAYISMDNASGEVYLYPHEGHNTDPIVRTESLSQALAAVDTLFPPR